MNTDSIDRASINRENAQHSTGPRTNEGKQRTKYNGMRHGLTSQVVVMPHEDLNAYLDHCKSFQDDFQPKGANETYLVQTLADCAWKVHRARAIETNLLTQAVSHDDHKHEVELPPVQTAMAMATGSVRFMRDLANLSLQEGRISRQYERTLKLLKETQAERKSKELDDLLQAQSLYQAHADAQRRKPVAERQPYEPATDGFAFTSDDLVAFINRRQRLDNAMVREFDRREKAAAA